MKEQYTAPAVKLVGESKDVILGSGGIGGDVWGQNIPFAMEFQTDSID